MALAKSHLPLARREPGGAARETARPKRPAHPLAGLQRLLGNQAVGTLLGDGGPPSAIPPQVQARPLVAKAGDAYENEAESAARRVSGASKPAEAPSRGRGP